MVLSKVIKTLKNQLSYQLKSNFRKRQIYFCLFFVIVSAVGCQSLQSDRVEPRQNGAASESLISGELDPGVVVGHVRFVSRDTKDLVVRFTGGVAVDVGSALVTRGVDLTLDNFGHLTDAKNGDFYVVHCLDLGEVSIFDEVLLLKN